MDHLLAQTLNLPGGGQLQGPLDPERFTDLASIVNVSLPYLFLIAGIILLGYLIWGGYDYLTSMGDPKKAEMGKAKITHAVIGFIIIFVSYWLVQIVDFVFQLGVYN